MQAICWFGIFYLLPIPVAALARLAADVGAMDFSVQTDGLVHVTGGDRVHLGARCRLGRDVELQAVEGRAYSQIAAEGAFNVWRMGWGMDYPDANNIHAELFHKAARRKYRVCEEPIPYDHSQEGSFRIIKHGIPAVRDFIVYALSQRS